MATVKLKSIFTKEDIYTVLQLLKALADGADTNDADLQSQIDELKTKIDTLKPEPEGYAVDASGNVVINDSLHVAKTGDIEMGKNALVDGTLTLNAPEDLAFKTGSLDFSKLKNQHTVRYYAVLGGETSAPTGYISIAFTCNSPSGLEIDSPQDLFMVFGGQDIAVAGSFYFNGREYFPTYIHLGASINDSAIYGSTAEYYGSLEPVALSHWPNSLKIEDTVFNPD